MSFTFLAQKRIAKDIKNYINSDINKVGIYCHIDESNIQDIKALIIGPKNTPYENGFYFFNIHFPNDYPFSPPKVKFLTYEYGIRFNPNLYTNGKVCLSILGTWSGPGWTTVLNLNTVLLSIQSLLNENPLQNEPGFETETGKKSIDYTNVIEYSNIKSATIKNLESPPEGFAVFKPTMIEHFIKNIDFYRKYTLKNKKKNNASLTSSIYSMKTQCNLDFINERIEFHYEKYTKELQSNPKNDIPKYVNSEQEKEKDEKPTEKKKKKRKCPNIMAKMYDVGVIKLSENDNKHYKVIQINGPKRTMKRWVLNK